MSIDDDIRDPKLLCSFLLVILVHQVNSDLKLSLVYQGNSDLMRFAPEQNLSSDLFLRGALEQYNYIFRIACVYSEIESFFTCMLQNLKYLIEHKVAVDETNSSQIATITRTLSTLQSEFNQHIADLNLSDNAFIINSKINDLIIEIFPLISVEKKLSNDQVAIAASVGDFQTVRELLERDADPNATIDLPDGSKKSLLQFAIKDDAFDICTSMLINKGADLKFMINENPNGIMDYMWQKIQESDKAAGIEGSDEAGIIKAILARADLEEFLDFSYVPYEFVYDFDKKYFSFMWAAYRHKQEKILEILKDKGERLNIFLGGPFQKHALTIAIETKNDEDIAAIIKYEPDNPPADEYVAWHQEAICRLIALHKFDLAHNLVLKTNNCKNLRPANMSNNTEIVDTNEHRFYELNKSMLFLAVYHVQWQLYIALVAKGATDNSVSFGDDREVKFVFGMLSCLVISKQNDELLHMLNKYSNLIVNCYSETFMKNVPTMSRDNIDKFRGFVHIVMLKVLPFLATTGRWDLVMRLIKDGANDYKNISTLIPALIKLDRDTLAKTLDQIVPFVNDSKVFIRDIMAQMVGNDNKVQIKCTEYNYIEVTNADLDKIYGASVARTVEIQQSLTEESGALLSKIKEIEPYFDQIAQLMQLFIAMVDKPEGITENQLEPSEDPQIQKALAQINSFKIFTDLIKKPSYFGSSDKKIYEAIKTNLEEIYVKLKNTQMNKQQKSILFDDFARQLLVCGPGIINSILHVRAYLEQNDIILWLAEYRRDIVLGAAAENLIETNAYAGMLNHVEALFMMSAQLNGLAPLAGSKQLAIGDSFVNPNNFQSTYSRYLLPAFKEKYNLNNVIDKILAGFLIDLNKIWPNSEKSWKSRRDYEAVSEQIAIVAKKHGMIKSSEELHHNLIISSEDGAYFKLNVANLDVLRFCILETFARLDLFVEPYILNMKTEDKGKIKYIVDGGRTVLAWDNLFVAYLGDSKQEPNDNIYQILQHEVEQQSVNPDLLSHTLAHYFRKQEITTDLILVAVELVKQNLSAGNAQDNVKSPENMLRLATALLDMQQGPKNQVALNR